MKVRIEKTWAARSWSLWIYTRRKDETYFAKPSLLEFELVPEAQRTPDPTLELSEEFAVELFQALGAELVRNGFLTDPTRVSGLYEAQTKHLEDMRKIAMTYFVPQIVLKKEQE